MVRVGRWLRVAAVVAVVAAAGAAGGQAMQDQALCSQVEGAAGCNVVDGYRGNSLASAVEAATIAGGGLSNWPQRATGRLATIGGGAGNLAGLRATVGGGLRNSAEFYQATVGGGALNVAHGNSATVAGGYENVASGDQSTVGGGDRNRATSLHASVAGGSGNTASQHFASVGGGTGNLAAGTGSTVGGGVRNQASGSWSSVAGGLTNQATALESAVGGGAGNRATAYGAGVAAGLNNHAAGSFSTIAGGRSNVAGSALAGPEEGAYATVGGGTENVAGGAFSLVPGGDGNTAAAAHSLAAGHRAEVHADHAGAFLYADSTDVAFQSLAADEFAVRATGGVRLVTAVDAGGAPAAGVRLPAGSGSWEMLSDRSAKVAFAAVNPQHILVAVRSLPLSTWSYATEAEPARHLGPTAQDFYAAFGLGSSDTTISAVDADGVALAAIQGLVAENERLNAQVAGQQTRIDALEARLESLERAGEQLEAQSGVPSLWLAGGVAVVAGATLAGSWRRRRGRRRRGLGVQERAAGPRHGVHGQRPCGSEACEFAMQSSGDCGQPFDAPHRLC